MSYTFDGTNQYLRTSSFPVSALPITIACWFKGNGSPGAGAFWPVVVAHHSTNGSRVILAISTTDIVASIVDAAGTVTADNGRATATNTYSSGVLTHACAVHTSLSSRTVYVNGINSAISTTSYVSFNIERLSIATNHAAGSFFNGQIADVGIWSVALTADEIVSLSKGIACNHIRPQSLVFYAPLIRNLVDIRGGLSITNNNGATISDHPRIYL